MLAHISEVNLLRDIPLLIRTIERVVKNPITAVEEDTLPTNDFIANGSNMALLSQ
jgi:hypothetical protein